MASPSRGPPRRGVVRRCSSLLGRACRPRGRRCRVHDGCCVLGRCWVWGVAPGHVLHSVLRFPAALLNKITGRVGSGQPNSYRTKKKTRYFCYTAMAMAAVMAPPL